MLIIHRFFFILDNLKINSSKYRSSRFFLLYLLLPLDKHKMQILLTLKTLPIYYTLSFLEPGIFLNQLNIFCHEYYINNSATLFCCTAASA